MRMRAAHISAIAELRTQYPSTGPEGTEVRSAANCALREGGVCFMAK